MEIDQALADAYMTAHSDRRAAIAALKAHLAKHPHLPAAARARAEELRSIVAARTQGPSGQCGCYISKMYLDLLDAALA